jgi:hypothetical protein
MSWSWVLVDDEPSDPGARFNHAMVLDSSRGVVVMYGGSTSGLGNDTWEWDGSTWTNNVTATDPGERQYGAAMAYDSARNVVVMYGGEDSGGTLDETWEYNGTDWTNISPAADPGANNLAAMAYDVANGKCVFFRGSDATTWTYNGTNWTQESPATSPSSDLLKFRLAYDTSRSRVVLFGGVDSLGSLKSDTWEWDGSDWAQMTPATTTPSARHSVGLAYDPILGGVVMANGKAGLEIVPLFVGDSWLWDGSDWSMISSESTTIGSSNFDDFTEEQQKMAREGSAACDGTGIGNGHPIIYSGVSSHDIF